MDIRAVEHLLLTTTSVYTYWHAQLKCCRKCDSALSVGDIECILSKTKTYFRQFGQQVEFEESQNLYYEGLFDWLHDLLLEDPDGE